jgi:hypothetical protein
MRIAVQNIRLQSQEFTRIQDKPGILDLIRHTIDQEEKGWDYDKEENPFRKRPGFQVGSELIQFYGEITRKDWVSHISASTECGIKVVIRDFRNRNNPFRGYVSLVGLPVEMHVAAISGGDPEKEIK